MKAWFADLPIRRKFALILLGSNTLALLTLFTAMAGHQLVVFRSELAERFASTAQMLALNSSAALAFADERAAHEVLQALSADHNVVCAHTLTPTGAVQARYGQCPDIDLAVAMAAGEPAAPLQFTQSHHDMLLPVVLDGSPVGAVHLRFSLAAWHAQLRSFLGLLGLTLAVTAAITLWLSALFQRAIARPIGHLAGMMRRVSGQRDYSLRAQPLGGDEVGTLMTGFNDMLGEIEEREARLQRQNEGLEAEVARRTAELSRARDAAEAAAQSLKRSEQHYRSLAEAMPIAVFTTEADGKPDYVNQTLLRYYGHDLADRLDPDWARYTHPEDQARVRQVKLAAMASGQPVELTTRELRHDGTYRWHITRALPLRDESGAVVKWFGAMLDVEDLQHAREAAEAAVRAKSDFLATMSHEIRTPLNGVIGMGDLLGATALSPQQQEFVDAIRHSAGLLMAVINDVLDFSKIEAGQMQLEQRPFDLHDCLRAAVNLVTPQAAAKRLELLCLIDPAVPQHIVGDETRLSQILVNLLNNAVKFTGAGRVALAATVLGPGELQIAISDSGIGMSQEQRARLFLPFCQGDASTTRRFGGTGLGLAICKRLVDAMGGQIVVSSTPGEGSTFSLRVPAVRVAAPQVPAAARPETAPQAASESPGDCRILLVEDNEINQIVTTAMLRRLGYETQLAENGRIGVDMVKAQPIDLILMDMQMPDLDGLEATRRIRRELPPERGQPHIIAVTANALQADRERCLAAGMDDYLSKPVRFTDLSEALRRFAQRRRPPPAAP